MRQTLTYATVSETSGSARKQPNVIRVEGRDALAQLEKAHAKQKAAEDNAAAAQRKCDDAEREALRVRGELEELRERLERVQLEADALSDLNARIETAKHVGDLFP
jgi:predicted  nucleic acid-binding Zn-ribbon protein